MRHPPMRHGRGHRNSVASQAPPDHRAAAIDTLLDESQGRIKMLVAPAGYGKTTLARQWLEGKPATLVHGTTPPRRMSPLLAAGLRAAISSVVSGAGDALIERLPVTARPDDDASLLASMLSQDLMSWPGDAWLVVDDYHEIAGSPPAERFLETLLLEAPLNVLLMSRRRPGWASSRRILYGEVCELDRAALAMTSREAHELLRDAGPGASELVDLAQGWPAVLALASVSDAVLPDLTAAPQLYGFFADEIYRRIDPPVRRVLCELALYDTDGRHLALSKMQPDVVERVVTVGVDSGFLTELHDKRLGMHPLLRTFLQRKLEADRLTSRQPRVVERAAGVLIAHQLWDESVRADAKVQPRAADSRSSCGLHGRAACFRPSNDVAQLDRAGSQGRADCPPCDGRTRVSGRSSFRV